MKLNQFLLPLLVSSVLLNACKKVETSPQTISLSNIVTNGDMEASPYVVWESYLGKNWSANPNQYTIEYTTKAASSPVHSIKVSCDAVQNDSTFQFIQQTLFTSDVPVPIGAKLTLKAKIKTVNIQGNGIALALGANQQVNGKVSNAFYTSTAGKVSITGTNEFKEYTIAFDSFPTNAINVFIQVLFLPNTAGAAYYDDISLSVN